MVISHILGGIGNQMFQYAAGRALALKYDRQQLLDLSDFSSYRLHNGFELSRVFNVDVERAEPADLRKVLGWMANRLVRKVLKRRQFALLKGRRFVVEPHFNFWPDFFNLTEGCYLSGYWQSEHYFKSFENIIRKDFTFKEPLAGINADLAFKIAQENSVSLHVRRGDYVSDSKTSHIMNICSLDYYHKSIEYITASIEQPKFYIFSDDMTWGKNNLPMNFPCTYIDHNQGAESYRDMQLMSLCKHHIIANSSFSWWGAWLNSNSNKLVVAPKSWFCNGNDDADLIPVEWVRL